MKMRRSLCLAVEEATSVGCGGGWTTRAPPASGII